jgi:predicted DNA-binding WGR domain protein
MELVQRTTLCFREGNSDKVYEVDLCRVSEEGYLVNFRYGRRGATLKDGSKTSQPVPLAQAQKLFNGLVQEKTKKGYQDVSQANVTAATVPDTPGIQSQSSDPRHQAILNRLGQRNDENWPLDRVIWRAGELAIPEAASLLVNLIGSTNALRDYSLAWALGWCGGSSTIAVLQRRLLENPATPDFVKRIAWEAIFKLSDPAGRAALQAEKVSELPSRLQALLQEQDAAALTQALPNYLTQPGNVSPEVTAAFQQFNQTPYWQWSEDRAAQTQIKAVIQAQIPALKTLATKKYSDYYKGYFEIQTALKTYISDEESKHYAVLDTLYQADHPCGRVALLELLKTTPFKQSYFQRFRHIFKMAEYRQDADFFAVFAHRFDRNRHNSYSYRQVYRKPTREYLQRRAWRTLRTLAQDGQASMYIQMATAVLLEYSDADTDEPRNHTYRRYDYSERRYIETGGHWDAYARHLTLNHLLYERSPRYQPRPKAWICKAGYKPGDPLPTVREEAFPELWQQHPDALLTLLLQSRCRPVHQFATRALQDCPDYCQQLTLGTLIQLFGTSYPETLDFAFNLVCERYNPAQPDLDLIVALINCQLERAREQAYTWIEAQREFFLSTSGFLLQVIASEQPQTRQFARRLLGGSLLSESATRRLVTEIIIYLLACVGEASEASGLAGDVGQILLDNFMPQLRGLSFNVVLNLLNHPLKEVKEVGAQILLNHETPAADLPPNLIESLLASPYEVIRGIGVRIFGQLPDERLLSDRVLIMAMMVNASPDLRSAIRPVIQRLAQSYPDAAQELARDCLNLLTIREPHEGVHADLITLLQQDIPGWKPIVSRERTLELLGAKSTAIQELAGHILQDQQARFLADFTTQTIVKLGSHEILAVRQAACQMFSQRLMTIQTERSEMLAAVRLLEAKWPDSKAFALETLKALESHVWTPELLVFICDSTQPDVRQFGRELVLHHFQAGDGQDYLLKFSEHPAADMQVFATNYLTTYAADSCERLQELTPYFVSVLCRVNKGRIAKQRIFQFLGAEAQKSEAAARIVAEILTRQSVTIAIGDKASAIEIMVTIKHHYPDIPLPLQVQVPQTVQPRGKRP